MKLRITVQGVQYEVDVEVLDDTLGAMPAPSASAAPRTAPAAPAPAAAPARAKPAAPKGPAPAAGPGDKEIKSPIAGNVFRVDVKPGDQVNADDTLLVLEAMKMETNVSSPIGGTVKEVLVKAGDSVTAGQTMVTFE
ncbi:MAG: biotin/lipoyl-binding protein [Phycisphaeraceae bacterium]|nr:biotin/lipoyl-binding protein [Phycisphaeraceae bacterium]